MQNLDLKIKQKDYTLRKEEDTNDKYTGVQTKHFVNPIAFEFTKTKLKHKKANTFLTALTLYFVILIKSQKPKLIQCKSQAKIKRNVYNYFFKSRCIDFYIFTQ